MYPAEAHFPKIVAVVTPWRSLAHDPLRVGRGFPLGRSSLAWFPVSTRVTRRRRPRRRSAPPPRGASTSSRSTARRSRRPSTGTAGRARQPQELRHRRLHAGHDQGPEGGGEDRRRAVGLQAAGAEPRRPQEPDRRASPSSGRRAWRGSICSRARDGAGAEVFIDGASRGTIPNSFELPAGRHQVEVKKAGLQAVLRLDRARRGGAAHARRRARARRGAGGDAARHLRRGRRRLRRRAAPRRRARDHHRRPGRRARGRGAQGGARPLAPDRDRPGRAAGQGRGDVRGGGRRQLQHPHHLERARRRGVRRRRVEGQGARQHQQRQAGRAHRRRAQAAVQAGRADGPGGGGRKRDRQPAHGDRAPRSPARGAQGAVDRSRTRRCSSTGRAWGAPRSTATISTPASTTSSSTRTGSPTSSARSSWSRTSR